MISKEYFLHFFSRKQGSDTNGEKSPMAHRFIARLFVHLSVRMSTYPSIYSIGPLSMAGWLSMLADSASGVTLKLGWLDFEPGIGQRVGQIVE